MFCIYLSRSAAEHTSCQASACRADARETRVAIILPPEARRRCARPRHDTVSERLRRWTRNPLGSARRGSNPLAVAFVPSKGFFFIVLALALHAFFSFLCVVFLTPCLSPSRSNSPFILPSLSTLCFSTSSLFLFHISPLSHSLCVLLYAGAGKPCVPHRNCSCGLMDKAPPS